MHKFNEEVLIHPEATRACPLIDADAVFEAALKDYSSGALFLGSKSAAAIEFWLTDCESGQLLWKAVGGGQEHRRLIGKVFNSFPMICEVVITIPRYQQSGK